MIECLTLQACDLICLGPLAGYDEGAVGGVDAPWTTRRLHHGGANRSRSDERNEGALELPLAVVATETLAPRHACGCGARQTPSPLPLLFHTMFRKRRGW